MNSQLLLAVSQIHQQELRQAASEARMASQSRTETQRFPRLRFKIRTPRTAPAISAHVGAQARTV